jgi:hypothetical protein
VVFYWIGVFWRALVATWSLVADRPGRSILLALVTVFVFMALAASGKKPLMQELRPWLVGLVPIAMAAFIVFVYQLIVTPARIYDEKEKEITNRDRRLAAALLQLPEYLLSAEEKEKFRQIVSPFAPSVVIIEYLNENFTHSTEVAQMLAEIFESAGWKVTLTQASFEKIPVGGVVLRTSDIKLSDEQKAVISAFQAVGMRCQKQRFEFVDVPNRRIELVIGQL